MLKRTFFKNSCFHMPLRLRPHPVSSPSCHAVRTRTLSHPPPATLSAPAPWHTFPVISACRARTMAHFPRHISLRSYPYPGALSPVKFFLCFPDNLRCLSSIALAKEEAAQTEHPAGPSNFFIVFRVPCGEHRAPNRTVLCTGLFDGSPLTPVRCLTARQKAPLQKQPGKVSPAALWFSASNIFSHYHCYAPLIRSLSMHIRTLSGENIVFFYVPGLTDKKSGVY